MTPLLRLILLARSLQDILRPVLAVTMPSALLALAFLASGCSAGNAIVEVPAPPPPPAPPSYGQTSTDLNALLSDRFDETRAVDVLYVTNRAANVGGCDDASFGVELVKDFSFGRCRMNVPKLHPVGGIAAAEDPRDDPNTYYRALTHQPLTREAFRAALSDSTQPDVLVLVHGFNVKFGEAILRASQIAYDLKFQGPVVLFSWPAGPRGGFSFINRTYEQNQENAQASIEPAAAFFELLASVDKSPHVLVHSMGHQVVIPGLVSASRRLASPFLGELILNAPDIPVDEFAAAAPTLLATARRITVYCSYNDNAIAASEAFNDGRRLGACEQIEGVDVINVGEIDAPAMGVAGLGHGYYASRPILTDVFQVLMGIDAPLRLFIRASEPNSTENFYLRQ